MILFRRCQPEHLRYITPQEAQQYEAEQLVPVSDEIVTNSVALSAWLDERCVGAAGVYSVWHGRAAAWALFSPNIGSHMIAIVRRMNRVLDDYPARRIEMIVRDEFTRGHKLAQTMGFHCETPTGMTGFFPDGTTGYLYVRVKSWE